MAGVYLEGLRWNASLTEAAQHVTKEVETQGDITQEALNDNAKKSTTIDNAYSSDGMQPSGDMPPVRSTPNGTRPMQRVRSKVYGLTFQQCDLEQAKANSLWNWANQQAAVK